MSERLQVKHNPVQPFDQLDTTFKGALMIYVLKADGDIVEVDVFAGREMTVPMPTDLRDMDRIPATGTGKELQLLPKDKEVLQVIQPDGQAAACVTIPRWTWTQLVVTSRG